MAVVLPVLISLFVFTPKHSFADTLECSGKANIVAGNTAAAADVKGCFDNIVTFSTNIANDNIKTAAAIANSKLNLASIAQTVAMTGKEFLMAKGADVASGTSITLGTDGNTFDITGTTTIQTITAKQAGTVVFLHFDSALTLTDDTGNLELGGTNVSVAAEDDVILRSDGTNWNLVGTSKRVNALPENYRDDMKVEQASSATLTVGVGLLEVNTKKISKTAATTMTLTTAGDWAGGSSLQATDTTGYVGIDSSGNIKLHTTAPSHSDYALAITAGTKRYVSWSSTTYRVIGWFRMNATGSGELDAYGVSNIAEMGVTNIVSITDSALDSGTTQVPIDDTIPQNTEGDEYITASIVPTNINNKLLIEHVGQYGVDSADSFTVALFQDSTAGALKAVGNRADAAARVYSTPLDHDMAAGTVSYTTFKIRAGRAGVGTTRFNSDSSGRLYGGVSGSILRITEIIN